MQQKELCLALDKDTVVLYCSGYDRGTSPWIFTNIHFKSLFKGTNLLSNNFPGLPCFPKYTTSELFIEKGKVKGVVT